MNLYLDRITPKEWNEMSEMAHQLSFGVSRSPDMNRIDFALIVKNDKELCTWGTFCENDKNSVYMQHGGMMPSISNSIYSIRAYMMIINYVKELYDNLATRIYVENEPMIKMSWKAGFKIVGTDICDNKMYLTLAWSRKNKE
jgi:hypothetical protein